MSQTNLKYVVPVENCKISFCKHVKCALKPVVRLFPMSMARLVASGKESYQFLLSQRVVISGAFINFLLHNHSVNIK